MCHIGAIVQDYVEQGSDLLQRTSANLISSHCIIAICLLIKKLHKMYAYI